MNSYKRKTDREFDRGNSGGNSRYNDRSNDRSYDRPTEKFSATCDTCHKPCQVPFKPTNGKPIFCDDCFRASKSNEFAGGGDRGGRREYRSESRQDSRPSRGENNWQARGGNNWPARSSENRAPRSDKSEQILAELQKLNSRIEELFTNLEPRVIKKVKMVDKKTKKIKLDFSEPETE